jgi:hypothetical protein
MEIESKESWLKELLSENSGYIKKISRMVERD